MNNMNEYILSQLPIQVQKELTEDVLTGVVNPTIEVEHTMRGLLFKMKAFVITHHLEPYTITVPKTVEYQVPATWLDDFKRTYRNKWWMPFSKVEYKTLKIDTSVTIVVDPQYMFPHFDPTYPRQFGKPFKITTFGHK
jgi:hypothetical protein